MSHLPKLIIGAGDFESGRSSARMLRAFLGSCVGVAIHDSEANVGGLIHLLLPEPLNIESSWHSEKYASTGLPIFIESLKELGAKPERMKASVAGGALVGAVSVQDLDLDIGGRTVEVVESILTKERIKIDDWETGGYFTCNLDLNMQSWKARIKPLCKVGSKEEEQSIEPASLGEIVEGLSALRPIPQIVLKIVRMIADQETHIGDIADQVRQDQTIAAKVLNMCNSSYFSTIQRVDSIDRALIMLGDKNLLKLVVSATMETFYPQNDRGYSLCRGGLYQHALGTALAAGQLATLSGLADSDVAYTAGLLHDIGKVALDQRVAKASPYFYRQTQMKCRNLRTVEQDAIGVDHATLGGIMAEDWNFPPSLVSAIRHHHQPERAETNLNLTHIIYLADLLMSRFHVGLELENIGTKRTRSQYK